MSLAAEVGKLIDSHKGSYVNCKGCKICSKIQAISKGWKDNGPADKQRKIAAILSKGEEMTKSDITFLLDMGVAKKEIIKALGIGRSTVLKLLAEWGFEKKRGEKDEMARLEMTAEEYVKLKENQNWTIRKISDVKGVSEATIYAWRKNNQEAIQQARERIRKQNEGKSLQEKEEILKQPLLRSSEHIDEPKKTRKESPVIKPVIRDEEKEQIKAENVDLKAKLEKIERMLHESSAKELEQQEEIDKLKREVIDAHKLVTEKQEELDQFMQEHKRQFEAFNEAMASKQQLHKENIWLENENSSLRTQLRNTEKTLQLQKKEASEHYLEAGRLQRQLQALKSYMFEDMRKELQEV